jgi:flagellar hook-basal body complex protein FliE
MSQMEIDAVLAQIRSLSSQTRVGMPKMGGPEATQQSGKSEFASLMAKGIDSVNQTDQRATKLSDAFQRGEPGVELPQVMLEMQKATLGFRAVTEVRNRLVTAYQDIMNMQV